MYEMLVIFKIFENFFIFIGVKIILNDCSVVWLVFCCFKDFYCIDFSYVCIWKIFEIF